MSIATDALDTIASAYRRGERDYAVWMAKAFIRDYGVGTWGSYAVEACDRDHDVVVYFQMRGGTLPD